jgi:hypothetical protein
MLPRFGGTLTPTSDSLFGGSNETHIDYPLPPHASDEMRSYLEPLKTFEQQPDFIARLPGGRVFGPGIVLSPDGRSLARDVSEDFGKTREHHWLLTYEKMRPPVHVSGSSGVVAVTLGEGYCHWLLEELPRLLLLRRVHPEAGLIAHTQAPFIREAIGFGGFGDRFLEAKRYSHFECEELLIPSLIGGPGHPTPRMLAFLAGFVAPLHEAGRSSVFGERLYLSREKAGRRRVSNESELWSRLEAQGFSKIFTEDLSWKEQINAFAKAKVIVAPHGAGLANLAFCPPGVRVVELFNRAYVNPCFWRLAGLKNLDYRPVVSGGEGPVTCDPAANRHDICADINGITNTLIHL